jgi:uncharacterized protein
MGEFEWDPNKESRNICKHHTDFTTASLIWDGWVFETPDNRHDYGESRLVAIGEVEDRILWSTHGADKNRRIISARKANPREKRRFEAESGSRGQPPPD